MGIALMLVLCLAIGAVGGFLFCLKVCVPLAVDRCRREGWIVPGPAAVAAAFRGRAGRRP